MARYLSLVFAQTDNAFIILLMVLLHCLNTLITTNAPYFWLEVEHCGNLEAQEVSRHRGLLSGLMNVMCPAGTLGASIAWSSNLRWAPIPFLVLQVFAFGSYFATS